MYGELVRVMYRRARSFLRSARVRADWGDLDLALFDVEQALQLYLKALLLELFGVRTRVHGVLEHLSILGKELAGAGFKDLAVELSDFIRENRRLIDLIDESYIASRYEIMYLEPGEVSDALKFANKLIEMLEKIRRAVRGEQ